MMAFFRLDVNCCFINSVLLLLDRWWNGLLSIIFILWNITLKSPLLVWWFPCAHYIRKLTLLHFTNYYNIGIIWNSLSVYVIHVLYMLYLRIMPIYDICDMYDVRIVQSKRPFINSTIVSIILNICYYTNYQYY